VITLLRHGVNRLATGKRRTRLDAWLKEDLPLRFDGRILSVDQSMIAKAAKVHHLTVATRNVDDFKPAVDAVQSLEQELVW
jgi:toxin FitB